MSLRRSVPFALVALLGALPLPAAAEPCARWSGALPSGPLQVGFFDGDVGRPRRVCARSELALAGGGSAILDTPNFYGSLGGGAQLQGSWAIAADAELFAAIEAVHFRFVQNATLTHTYLGPGLTSIGGTWRRAGTENLAVATTARLTLPTAFGLYRNAWPVAADVGAAFQWIVHPMLSAHGGFGGVGMGALGGADPGLRLGFQLLAGVEVRPWERLSLVADVSTLLGWADAVDQLTAAAGLRGDIGWGFGVEAAAMLPLAGSTRTDFAGALRISRRL